MVTTGWLVFIVIYSQVRMLQPLWFDVTIILIADINCEV